jgi:hypothetical protein
MKRLVAGLSIALLVAGCSSSTQPLPVETIPPDATAPAGWASIGGISGSGGQGAAGIQLDLYGHQTAIHAACSGNGTLVVQIGDAATAPVPAVVFPCGGHGAVADTRFELTSTIRGSEAFVVFVLPGNGTLFNPSFAVSVEQAKP